MIDHAFQRCIRPACGRQYALDEVLFSCRACGGMIDIAYDWSHCDVPKSLGYFTTRRGSSGGGVDTSGVWRFRELLPFAGVNDLVTLAEGQTLLQKADELARALGFRAGHLYLQYEGFNPTGSFKDNGMAAAFTAARLLGRRRVACASTGNTSAAVAFYAAHTRTLAGQRMQAIVFVGSGKIAHGKLAQALDYGATTLQIAGDFDICMKLVQESADRLDLYLMNSVNPFRLEGQKTIMYRVLEGLGWEVPDWIVVPGGNLGNSSAFGKAFVELHELGLIHRMPRLAIINATGASTLYELHHDHGIRYARGAYDAVAIDSYYSRVQAEGRAPRTIASAIEIGRPVNLPKALRSLDAMDGVVRHVDDDAILDAKALVGRYGYGCEPASGAAVAGLQLLLREGVIAPSDRAVCILTGHALKDPAATIDYHSGSLAEQTLKRYTNAPISVAADMEAIATQLAMRG